MPKDKKLTIQHYINENLKDRSGLYIKVTYNRKTTKIASYSEQYTLQSTQTKANVKEEIISNDLRIIHELKSYYENECSLDFDVSFLNVRGTTLTSMLVSPLLNHVGEVIHDETIDFMENEGLFSTATLYSQSYSNSGDPNFSMILVRETLPKLFPNFKARMDLLKTLLAKLKPDNQYSKGVYVAVVDTFNSKLMLELFDGNELILDDFKKKIKQYIFRNLLT